MDVLNHIVSPNEDSTITEATVSLKADKLIGLSVWIERQGPMPFMAMALGKNLQTAPEVYVICPDACAEIVDQLFSACASDPVYRNVMNEFLAGKIRQLRP